jgi:DNA polymerase III sliding clamp (beta) subunit (PCNA family)
MDKADRVVIEGRKLINGVEKTAYAASKRKKLLGTHASGMRLFIENGRINFIASNGYRLAMYSVKLIKDNIRRRRAYTVLAKEMEELIENIQKDDEIEITVEGDGRITFSSQNFSKSIELLQVKYPPYHKIIPRVYNIKIEVSKDELKDAINSIVKERTHKDSETGPYERIVLRLQDKRLVVSTISPMDSLPEDYRSKICDIPAKVLHNYFASEDEEYTSPYVCLNEIYLKHAMNPIKGAKVVIGFVNEYSPVAFLSPDPTYGYLGLVMPMDPEGGYKQLALIK